LLSSDGQEYPFAKSISTHSAPRFAQDFFFDISAEMLGELTTYQQERGLCTNAMRGYRA
jgi:hypothetical protein